MRDVQMDRFAEDNLRPVHVSGECGVDDRTIYAAALLCLSFFLIAACGAYRLIRLRLA